jgi:hypothetical protein
MTRLTTFSTWRQSALAVAVAAIAGTSLAACDTAEPVAAPQDAQQRVTDTVPAVVDSTVASLDFLQTSTTLAQLGDAQASLAGAFPSLGFLQSGDTTEPAPAPATGTIASIRHRGHQLLADPATSDDSGAAIAKFLREVVFTEENYEGDGYYLLGGDDLCGEDPTTGAPDPECVSTVDDAELRVHAVLAGDGGVDLSLAVGPDRVEPITFELRPASIAVVVDLGAARDAVAFLASLTGEDIDLPDVLEGVVAAQITVNGPQDVTISASIREAVRVEATLPSGAPISLSSAASDPLASVHVAADAGQLDASFDLGRTQLSAPWQELSADSLATGTMALDLRGVSASVSLEEGAQSLQITDIGLGDGTSTLMLDDATLVAVDLNADAGRRFTLTVLPEDGGQPTFGFDPEFDLSVAFGLQPLADAGDEVESFLLDETYRITADGDMPTLQPIDADEAQGTPGALRVVSGQLAVSSTAADAAVTVASGKCLLEDELTDGEHPVLGHLAAGDCP